MVCEVGADLSFGIVVETSDDDTCRTSMKGKPLVD